MFFHDRTTRPKIVNAPFVRISVNRCNFSCRGCCLRSTYHGNGHRIADVLVGHRDVHSDWLCDCLGSRNRSLNDGDRLGRCRFGLRGPLDFCDFGFWRGGLGLLFDFLLLLFRHLNEEALARGAMLRGRQQRHSDAPMDNHRNDNRGLLHSSTSRTQGQDGRSTTV